jgi:hypothetical protein
MRDEQRRDDGARARGIAGPRVVGFAERLRRHAGHCRRRRAREGFHGIGSDTTDEARLMAFKRPCLGCGTPTMGGRCPACRPALRGTTVERFGPGWARISRLVIERDGGICHLCGRPGADTGPSHTGGVWWRLDRHGSARNGAPLLQLAARDESGLRTTRARRARALPQRSAGLGFAAGGEQVCRGLRELVHGGVADSFRGRRRAWVRDAPRRLDDLRCRRSGLR